MPPVPQSQFCENLKHKEMALKLFRVVSNSKFGVYINPEYILSIEEKEYGTNIRVQGALVSNYTDSRDIEEVVDSINKLVNEK